MATCACCRTVNESDAAVCVACGESSFESVEPVEPVAMKRGPGRPRKQPPTPGQTYRDIIDAANELLHNKGI